ncbi:2-dehydro-3-deoxy-6-phosphogalactonate aldolase [Desulfosediminicola flagellatus]|uniref:2-dehydro-3-deoxy-6-phosphogalactonate aldolase n=1 Tax=Desulfosediminicola flagellatus TaxID=2569541 RepID=UPI0010ACB1A9|nr:2-dehydro-3-deoxy-6-phosphogalactonate aldolase [Desulfosediminicola flagellatus]
MNFKTSLQSFPFIAITRGIEPDEAVEYAGLLIGEGFQVIENPLNSPEPYETIRRMATHFGESAIIGAGTVTRPDQVMQVRDAGGKLIISPHCDIEVIKSTKECGLISIPGVATPTEAMAAIHAGADALKLFPAELVTPAVVKAIKAILPKNILLIPVGGIDSANWQAYVQAGAQGFGLGSSLYKKGMSSEQLVINARKFRKSFAEKNNSF